MNDERPDEFQLSDAPIHRIQTLVLSLQDSFKNLDGFKALSAAFFVRRDFDTRADAQCPVFNGTFYNPKIIDVQSPLCLSDEYPQGFSVEQLEALHQGALNSAGTPRATLEKAIRKINVIQDADTSSKPEYIHSWLELFSRVTYNGGVPGFLIDHFNHVKAVPLLNLVKVRKVRKAVDDKWKDCLIAEWDNGVAKWFGQKSWKDQPPLTTGCKIADPLYRSLQKWIERAEDWSGADSSPPANTPSPSDHFVIAVPVYDFLNIAEGPDSITSWGTFLGFLFLVFPPTTKLKFIALCKALPKAAPHLNAFAASLLESEFEEILREDFQGDDPLTFLAENLHRIDGWKFVTSLPGTQTLGVRQLEINLRSNLFQPAGPKETAFLTTSDCWTRYEDESSPAAENYRKRLNRRIRYFLEQARLQESKKRLGLLASAHDYSKDLNAIDSTFGRLSDSIEQAAHSVDQSLSKHPALKEIREKVAADLAELTNIRDQSLLRPRFMMAHARTQTEGYYYEQPAWCVDRLANGMRQDIYFLIRLLVWEPLGAQSYLGMVKNVPQAAEVADWSRLFAYDEVGLHPAVDDLLSGYLKRCFLRPLADGGPMTPEQFGNLHPPPALNAARKMSDVLLPGLKPRSSGIRGLLPLVVFSLRAAFQHAWLTSFIKAAIHDPDSGIFVPVTEPVTLSERMDDGYYCIQIEFPNPLAASLRERILTLNLSIPPAMPDRLPWGNWQREVNFYRGLGIPWIASLEHSAPDAPLRINITATRS